MPSTHVALLFGDDGSNHMVRIQAFRQPKSPLAALSRERRPGLAEPGQHMARVVDVATGNDADPHGDLAAPAGDRVVSDRQHHRARILEFYMVHNPAKAGEVDAVVRKFLGREQELYSMLSIKYLHEPRQQAGPSPAPVPKCTEAPESMDSSLRLLARLAEEYGLDIMTDDAADELARSAV